MAQSTVLSTTLDGFCRLDRQGRILEVNEAWCRMLGYTREELLEKSLSDVEADESAGEIAATIERVRQAGSAQLERRHRCKDGHSIVVEISVNALPGDSGELSALLRDVTARRQLEALLSGQNQVLAMIARGAALAQTLDKLLRILEAQSPEMLCSVLLLDAAGTHLRHGAAPSLPEDYMKAIDGGAIGPSAGSCGTAAFRREAVIVEDIAADPLWADYRALALPHGLRACWSTPIFDERDRVLGTFAMYYRLPGRPTAGHQRLIEIGTHIAAIAISREHSDEALRRSETKFRTLYDSAPDGVLLLDENGFFDCNPAALEAFGCASRSEICSKGPAALSPELQPCGTDSMTLANQRIAAALAEGSQRFEWVHKRADTGATFPAEVLLHAMELDGKRVLQAVVRDISERKRAEAALRENEDRYRDLIDNSQELISTSDLEGNILSVNETTIRITGYPREVLLRMNLADLLVPEARHLFPEYLRNLRTSGRAKGTMRIRTANGERRSWEYDTSLRTEGVDAPMVRGMALDITERLRSEKALRESHERFELATRATFNVIWDWNLKTNEFWRNENFRSLFGYEEDGAAASSRPPHELIHPDDLDRVQAGVQAALDSRLEFWADQYRFRRKDGSYATVDDRAIITRDSNGQATRMLGAMQDITERKRAEASLLLHSGALEAAANAIVITDRQGLIEWANQAFTAGTGYSMKEALGKRPGDLIRSGAQDAPFYADMWETILAGEVWRGELVNKRKDGSLYREEMTITPLKDVGGEVTHFVAVKQDITERKLLEERFLQAQKLEAVGRLAGGIAHDFNNMLGVILGYADIALGQVDSSQPIHKDLREIHKAAEHSAGLTRQLLAFARKETIAPKVLNLNETVAGMLTMLTRLIGEDIQVTFRPAATLWPVLMDPSQFDQILANLCVNSRDAIAGVGAITIATANCTIDAEDCAADTEAAPGDYVRLSVSDTGRGMDQETLAQIFEPFFTTKAVGEGTGLGLPMVYGAVKQNLGFLTVASRPGQGTVVEIFLPRHRGPAERERSTEARAPIVRGKETILVVEDESALLKLIARVLAAQGYVVIAASSPGEAIRMAREHGDEIHLLLTDVVMPEMNGRDLAKTLLSLYPRLRRLFMSGYTADVIGQGGLLEEGVHFLQKPFSQADLAARVRAVLDGS